MRKIVDFQTANGLSPDGVIGPITLNAFRDKLKLSKEQLANFLGQLHVETGGFEYDTESLNYSPKGLIDTFSYYSKRPGEAYLDGRTEHRNANQEQIANNVYWDRNRQEKYKLGNVHWGDGWKYRGRGSIQVTGRSNYVALGKYLKRNFLDSPEDVAGKYFWDSGIWYFDSRGLWNIAKEVSIESMTELTKKINGGTNGLDERMRWTRRYLYLQNR